MNVYLVTAGSYSDYCVLGVYSTPELAADAKLQFNTDNDVETFELDVVPDHPPGLFHYNVYMDRNGDTVTDGTRWFPAQVERVAVNSAYAEWCPYGDGRTVRFAVWATDAVHAVKIANERRVQLIASGEWTTDDSVWRARNPDAILA